MKSIPEQLAIFHSTLEHFHFLEKVGETMENNVVIKHTLHKVECAVTITPSRFVFRSPRPNRYTGSFANPYNGLEQFAHFVEQHHRG